MGKKAQIVEDFVKNMAAGAGGYTLAAFQTEPDRKKKSSDEGSWTKIEQLEAKVKMLEGKIRTLEDIELSINIDSIGFMFICG